MKGEDLKKIILAEGYSVAEMARCIGTSQQNLTCALSKGDVRTGLLEKISEVMGHPIEFFFGGNYNEVRTPHKDNNQAVDPRDVRGASNAELWELLKAKDEQLTMALAQISKAQEQMDKILNLLAK